MARGLNKNLKQAERVLSVLMSGNWVKLDEIHAQLKKQVHVEKFSTYLWELKKLGAVIEKEKDGRKLVSVKLSNVDAMKKYLASRGVEAFKKETSVSTTTDVSESVLGKVQVSL